MTHRGPFQPLPFCDSLKKIEPRDLLRLTRFYEAFHRAWSHRVLAKGFSPTGLSSSQSWQCGRQAAWTSGQRRKQGQSRGHSSATGWTRHTGLPYHRTTARFSSLLWEQPPSLPFATHCTTPPPLSLCTQPRQYPAHCLTVWLLTKIKNVKGKISCSSLLYVIWVFFPSVKSFLLQLFSFCRETISQGCCEFMWVSEVAQAAPLLNENYVTFVLTGYWKKISLHFLNCEHRSYHVWLASASPAANWPWLPKSCPDPLLYKAIYPMRDRRESPPCPSTTCPGLPDFRTHRLQFDKGSLFVGPNSKIKNPHLINTLR